MSRAGPGPLSQPAPASGAPWRASTSFVSKISKRGVVGWRQEEYREDCLGEGRKTPCLVPLEGWGWWESLSLVRAHTHTG